MGKFLVIIQVLLNDFKKFIQKIRIIFYGIFWVGGINMNLEDVLEEIVLYAEFTLFRSPNFTALAHTLHFYWWIILYFHSQITI